MISGTIDHLYFDQPGVGLIYDLIVISQNIDEHTWMT